MNRWLSIVLLSSALFALGLPAHADTLTSIRQSGKLRVGIAVGVPRFSYLDARQQLAGSDVDTATALANDLGVRPEFIRISNAERITALEKSIVDVVVSSLSITPERERVISFSPPYGKLFVVVAAPAEIHINGYADLAGLQIGVTRLTSNATLIEQNAPGAIMLAVDDDASLIKAAVAGKFKILSTQQAVIDEINRLGAKPPFEEKFVQKEFELAIGTRKPKNLCGNGSAHGSSKISAMTGSMKSIASTTGRTCPWSCDPTQNHVS